MRRPSSAHVVAFVALFAALGGGAVAAKKLGSEDIANNAVRSKHLKNGQVQTTDLSRAVRLKLDKKGGGLRGPKGDRGSRGPRGRRGYTGPTGPAGTFPSTLPAGQTLRGVYAVDDQGEDAIAFAFALPSAPAPHWLAAGATPTTECPGSAAAPTAAPGHLCVYEGSASGLLLERVVFDPAQGPTAAGTASPYGAGLTLADGGGASRSSGTWAVAAP